MAKMTEIATGSPSGTALTASAITNCSAAVSSIPRHSANPRATTDAASTTMTIWLTSLSIVRSTGLASRGWLERAASLPYSVAFPVAVTMASALPPITNDP